MRSGDPQPTPQRSTKTHGSLPPKPPETPGSSRSVAGMARRGRGWHGGGGSHGESHGGRQRGGDRASAASGGCTAAGDPGCGTPGRCGRPGRGAGGGRAAARGGDTDGTLSAGTQDGTQDGAQAATARAAALKSRGRLKAWGRGAPAAKSLCAGPTRSRPFGLPRGMRPALPCRAVPPAPAQTMPRAARDAVL